jgi:hypothetical protein
VNGEILRAMIEFKRRLAADRCASTHTTALLKHVDVVALVVKRPRRRQAGNAGPYDRDTPAMPGARRRDVLTGSIRSTGAFIGVHGQVTSLNSTIERTPRTDQTAVRIQFVRTSLRKVKPSKPRLNRL